MGWYAVRCVILHELDRRTYEERITLWQADTHETAIELAEQEAGEYASLVDSQYVELAQSYELYDDPCQSGAEVFSLMRDSELDPTAYTARFFATGNEHQGTI